MAIPRLAALMELAAEGDELALAILEKLTPDQLARLKAEHEAHSKARAEAEAKALKARARETIRRNRAVIRDFTRMKAELVRRADDQAQRVRAVSCAVRHRRAPRPAPVRSRGSRRGSSTRSSSRGGDSGDPDDADDVGHRPAAAGPLVPVRGRP